MPRVQPSARTDAADDFVISCYALKFSTQLGIQDGNDGLKAVMALRSATQFALRKPFSIKFVGLRRCGYRRTQRNCHCYAKLCKPR